MPVVVTEAAAEEDLLAEEAF